MFKEVRAKFTRINPSLEVKRNMVRAALAVAICTGLFIGEMTQAHAISGSDSPVDDVTDAREACYHDCDMQKLRDSLACGQAAQSCLANIVYLPYIIWISARSICDSNNQICEANASIAHSACSNACSQAAIDAYKNLTAIAAE